jgi:CubicO group peptidase (beta-lactamase class C family)
MRLTIFVISLALAFSSCTDEPVARKVSKQPDSIAQITDEYFTALTNMKKFNGVILVFLGDSILFQEKYNMYPTPDSSAYVDLDYQFDIHSVSKLMARTLIAKLEEEERISGSQTLDSFYPDFPQGNLITIDMLLDNRSGLPRELLNFEGKEADLSSDEIVAAAKTQPLLFEPGTAEQYSNVGYELVYDIIAKTYKKPFAQCLIDEIFIPCKMDRSGAWYYVDTDRSESPAHNHILRDSILIEVPNIARDEFLTARIYSTAADLHRFMLHLLEEPYASSLSNTDGVIGKSGGSRGIRAQVYVVSKSRLGYILLANYDEMPFATTVADMARIIRSEEVTIPHPINRVAKNLPDSIMQRYEGRYLFADFDGLVLRVAADGDTLALYEGEKKIGSLLPESETVFFENPKEAESLEFVPNDSGYYDAKMGWNGIVVDGVRIK